MGAQNPARLCSRGDPRQGRTVPPCAPPTGPRRRLPVTRLQEGWTAALHWGAKGAPGGHGLKVRGREQGPQPSCEFEARLGWGGTPTQAPAPRPCTPLPLRPSVRGRSRSGKRSRIDFISKLLISSAAPRGYCIVQLGQVRMAPPRARREAEGRRGDGRPSLPGLGAVGVPVYPWGHGALRAGPAGGFRPQCPGPCPRPSGLISRHVPHGQASVLHPPSGVHADLLLSPTSPWQTAAP